jgi:hypothetical protein
VLQRGRAQNGAQGRIALSDKFTVEISREFLASVRKVYQSRYTGHGSQLRNLSFLGSDQMDNLLKDHI